MTILKKMTPPDPKPTCYDFDFPQLDTAVTVETSATGVVIRASRPTFSEQRKRYFIRELVAEGFIDDTCQWWEAGIPGPIQWVVDRTDFMPGAVHVAQTRRFMQRLIISGAGLWLFMMGFLLLRLAR